MPTGSRSSSDPFRCPRLRILQVGRRLCWRWMPRTGCALDAVCSPERAFFHGYARGSGQSQMIPGWSAPGNCASMRLPSCQRCASASAAPCWHPAVWSTRARCPSIRSACAWSAPGGAHGGAHDGCRRRRTSPQGRTCARRRTPGTQLGAYPRARPIQSARACQAAGVAPLR